MMLDGRSLQQVTTLSIQVSHSVCSTLVSMSTCSQSQVSERWCSWADGSHSISMQSGQPAGSTNLAECTLPLIDFIKTLVKPGEKTAKAYFGARGWTASISGNIFGFTTPLESEDMSWNFNPMAGPWLATHVWDYYDYTRDKQFLKETGYELIKNSAIFAVDSKMVRKMVVRLF